MNDILKKWDNIIDGKTTSISTTKWVSQDRLAHTNVIYGGRATGKTTKLIQMSANQNFSIVCRDLREAKRIFDQATRNGIRIPFPITYYQLNQGTYRGVKIDGIMIDDAVQGTYRGVKIDGIMIDDVVSFLQYEICPAPPLCLPREILKAIVIDNMMYYNFSGAVFEATPSCSTIKITTTSPAMSIIYGGRATGKTTKLIQMSANQNFHIVCRSLTEAERIVSQATRNGIRIPFPITYRQLNQGTYRGVKIDGIMIDDVISFLYETCPYFPIKAIVIDDMMYFNLTDVI